MRVIWEWISEPKVSAPFAPFARKPTLMGFVCPAKFAMCRGSLLLLLRPGSDVSILVGWELQRAPVLVREVASALWRDAA